MKITTEYKIFRKIAKEQLDFNKPGDDLVRIREDKFLGEGVSAQGIWACIKRGVEDGLIRDRSIMYAPKSPLPTKPFIRPGHVSHPDETYSMPVYFLRFDAAKLLYAQAHLPKVYFNEKNASGFVDDKEFKFTNDSHAQVFAALYRNPGTAMPREEILRLYHKGEVSHKFGTMFVSQKATEIRRQTKLDPKYLQVRNSSFALLCDKVNHPPA